MKNQLTAEPKDHPLFQAKFNPTVGSTSKNPWASHVATAPSTPKMPKKVAISHKPHKSEKKQESETAFDGVDVFQKGSAKTAKFQTKLKPKKSRKKLLFIMIGIVLVLSGGLVAWSVYFNNQPSSAAVNTSATPFQEETTEHQVLKQGDLVQFGDDETTFKVSDEIRLDNLSHLKEAKRAFVYLEIMTGDTTVTVIKLKKDDKVSFGDKKDVYIVEKFGFNKIVVKDSDLCTIMIREMSKEAETTVN